MQLENIIVDATAPGRLGRFWEQALGTRTLIDSEEEGFETRLDLPGGGFLDLCFQPVPHRPTEPQRLHLDLLGGAAAGGRAASAGAGRERPGHRPGRGAVDRARDRKSTR